jgi:hypothetical protein
MPWSNEFQFRTAQHGFGATTLDTGEAVSANKNCDAGRGAARANVYADSGDRKAVFSVGTQPARSSLMAEVG